MIQAHAGILSVTGSDPDNGMKAGVPIADLSTGLYCTIGLLVAHREAQRTGRGATVEVSLAESCASLLSNQAMNYLIGEVEPRALGNTHPSIAPYQVVRAGDGSLAVAATSERQFGRLCAVLGLDELTDDPRFATNKDRVANRVTLENLLEAGLAHSPRSRLGASTQRGGCGRLARQFGRRHARRARHA